MLGLLNSLEKVLRCRQLCLNNISLLPFWLRLGRPKLFLTLVNDVGAVWEPLSRLPMEDALEQLLWLLSKLSEIALEPTEGHVIFQLDVCGAWVLPAETTDPTEARQQT